MMREANMIVYDDFGGDEYLAASPGDIPAGMPDGTCTGIAVGLGPNRSGA